MILLDDTDHTTLPLSFLFTYFSLIPVSPSCLHFAIKLNGMLWQTITFSRAISLYVHYFNGEIEVFIFL